MILFVKWKATFNTRSRMMKKCLKTQNSHLTEAAEEEVWRVRTANVGRGGVTDTEARLVLSIFKAINTHPVPYYPT